jgi:hypothetical protein
MPADALGAAGDDCGFSFQPRRSLLPAMRLKTDDGQLHISYEPKNRVVT